MFACNLCFLFFLNVPKFGCCIGPTGRVGSNWLIEAIVVTGRVGSNWLIEAGVGNDE